MSREELQNQKLSVWNLVKRLGDERYSQYVNLSRFESVSDADMIRLNNSSIYKTYNSGTDRCLLKAIEDGLEKFEDMYFECLQKEFSDCERLYHYTSLDSACKILSTKKLKFSKLESMNDLTESFKILANDRNLEERNFKYAKESMDDVKRSIYQISFAQDTNEQWGFDILPMWAHYANNGEGVCIVFDKKIIGSKAKECQSKNVGYLETHSVVYDTKVTNVINMSDFYCGSYEGMMKNCFFKKRNDWSYEQEYRMIAQPTSEEKGVLLNVDDAIKTVIMFNNEGGENLDLCINYKVISAILQDDIPILEYSLPRSHDDSVCLKYPFLDRERVFFP